jgi:hypothetical protein
MTFFEKKICEAFLSRFSGEQSTMRLRSLSIFPDFENASPDEKSSYLEAAESLEQKGLITLKWEKHRKGEIVKTLTAVNVENLFAAAEIKNPKNEVEEIRAMIKVKLSTFEKYNSDESRKIFPFLDFLEHNFSSLDVKNGMNIKTVEDILSLLEYFCQFNLFDNDKRTMHLTPRALSVKLFHDSKRLEKIIDLLNPFLNKVEKQGVNIPDFSFLKRSFPETLIAGKLIFEYKNISDNAKPPLINVDGHIIGFPLASANKIEKIKTLEQKDFPKVLTVENKETFYAFASSLSDYDCCLYTGGYPNRAAAALIKTLSSSGFLFYHAGDLDPDGILILQKVSNLAEKDVIPVCMNAETFNHYLPWARPLTKTMLHQVSKIRDDTKAIPGISELITKIMETAKGVEQEVIDYLFNTTSVLPKPPSSGREKK